MLVDHRAYECRVRKSLCSIARLRGVSALAKYPSGAQYIWNAYVPHPINCSLIAIVLYLTSPEANHCHNSLHVIDLGALAGWLRGAFLCICQPVVVV